MSSNDDVIRVGSDIAAGELNALIDEAPEGATLEFDAVHYRFDDAITIERSDVALVGKGADKTVFTFSQRALDRNDSHALNVRASDSETLGRLASGTEQGDTQLILDGDPALEEGDTVRIWQDNDPDFLDRIGDTGWRKQQHAELRTSMATVESIDGNEVTLDRGLHFDFDAGETQIARLESADNVRLEGFAIEFELGRTEKGDFSNGAQAPTGYHALSLEGTVDSQLNDIHVLDGPSTAFRFSRTLDLQAEALEAHGAFNKGSGGNGYGFELHESYEGEFTDLVDSGMRHGVLFASWRSSVNNDVHVAFTDRDINFHGGLDHGNRVHVERSIRDPEVDLLSPTLWINEGGETFGAPTDASANEVRFDHVVGSRRDDLIQGSDDGVHLYGGLGNDTLLGGAGNDVLQGGPGNDWNHGDNLLDGGDGIDTAVFTRPFEDYRIRFDGDEVLIEDPKGGSDRLVDIEYALFGDGTALDTESRTVFDSDPIEPAGEVSLPRLIDSQTEILVTGNLTSRWSGGHVAEVFVTNISDRDIVAPEVHFELPSSIDTLWNGAWSHQEEGYVVSDDRVIAPGEEWRFAYKAYGDDSALPDEASVISGQPEERSDIDVQLLGMNATIVDDLLA